MSQVFSKKEIKFCPFCGRSSRFVFDQTHKCSKCKKVFGVVRRRDWSLKEIRCKEKQSREQSK
ncbi:hypothetical protein KKG58_01205 [Patescibacteria group bacterium]|nr:hypothetical protein [Patescibacteria group bacterium]